MMKSHRHNSKARLWVLLLVFVAALFGGVEYFTGGFIRTHLRDTASHVWRFTQTGTAVVAESGIFHTKAALAKEVAELSRERETFLTIRLQNDVLRSENAALRGLLMVRESAPEGAAVRVLSRPGVSPYSTFVIEAGESQVAVGDVVFAAPSVVVGEVIEVGNVTSLVALYTAPGKDLLVRLRDDVLVPYTGRGGGNGALEVPRGIPISVGDSVFLPDSGFVMGVVGDVSAAPEDAVQKVLVAPPVNVSTLSFVYVARRP